MRETGTLRRDRMIAGVLVIAIHGVLGWGLARQLRVIASTSVAAPPLDVVWIAAPPLRVDSPSLNVARASGANKPVAASSPRPATTRIETAVHPEVSASDMSAKPTTPAGARPLAAAYIAQAGQWAAQQAPATISDPFADRVTTLPGRHADRFRMKPKIGPADVVGFVGQLFAGAGYDPDPCPELRANVERLGLADSAQDRRHAVEMERSLC